MNNHAMNNWWSPARWLQVLATLSVGVLITGRAVALELTVVDGAGAPVSDFRWLLEEDNTAPGIPGAPTNNTVSLVIHKSHASVVASGSSAAGPATVTIPGVGDPAATGKRYFVSVLAPGYSAGGADLKAGQTSVRVILNANPLPTAQINVLAFNDNSPINNVPDADEPGIPGCHVTLSDFLGGPILTDTFGNPLGTTYQTNSAGEYVLVDGAPEVASLGSGAIYTDANGKAIIKNLAMGKYGVQVTPPTGSDWKGGHASMPNVSGSYHQTATIEGTLTVDAWVKANEPRVFMEGFGPGNYHVFFGFVDPKKVAWATNPPVSGVTLRGTNRFNHFGRPPFNQQYAVGPAVTEAWVGLNAVAAGVAGSGLYAAPCDPDTGAFVITNVPPGQTYQLVTWDKPLDALFGINTIVVSNLPPGSVQDLGTVLSTRWFGTYEGSVFYDANANGFRDDGEVGIPQQTLNIRWRDGTVYQSTVTDQTGDFSFSEVFPFFKWLIAEVDFARFKPTGMTTVVDEGGQIPPDQGWVMPSEGVRNPQPQYEVNPDGTLNPAAPIVNPNTGNNLSRTALSTDPAAPLLLEATHLFLNQNNRIDWGKINYSPGENGGIAGIVGYGATRAEQDPRQGTIDPWESGIPRVEMVLYRDANADKVIDDLNGDGHPTLADIDNYPLGFRDGEAPGSEDVDRNGNGAFDAGDALQIAWTDSWDDSPPSGTVQTNPPVVLGRPIVGSDNYATWNQVREGVFDGGYAFGSYYPNGLAQAAPGEEPVNYLPAGMYIVQSCPPPGYLIQTEESFNVGFGDAYQPSKLLLPPELVGTPTNHFDDGHLAAIVPAVRQTLPTLFTVPDELSLFPGEPCAFAGQERPIADMKWVRVADGKNAAADFHVYTEVPKATRVVGFVLNDLTAEFNSQNPIFGEKGSPGWLPISFRDWAGHEVARTYSDEYGSYEALVPSSISAAIPMPSGFAPNMLTLVLNDPTMPDPANPGNRIPDPNYNPAYSTTPWTLHYYPATFLYADTPIVPVAAFVGGPNKQLDVEPPPATPVLLNVTVGPEAAPDVAGPYVPAPGTNIVNLFSRGTVAIPNPNYTNGAPTDAATVLRDFGFGAHTPGDGAQVTINGVAVPEADIVSWSNELIRLRIHNVLTTAGASGLVRVTRNNLQTSQIGVTLTRGRGTDVIGSGNVGNVHVVVPVDPLLEPLATPIQDAIDAAHAGDLILVPASAWDYNENPILWKPLQLQGAGLGTVINANPTPSERLAAWHAKAAVILSGDPQAADPFTAMEAPGLLVLGVGSGPYAANFNTTTSRVDGFQIKGAIAGGGIVVWSGASNVRISNNRVIGNQGSVSGGISLGEQAQAGTLYNNTNVVIEFNQILQNGGVNGAGGIGIFTGATRYQIRNNFIVGNFTRGSGGGIGHEGRSPGGLIANNVIAFNEVFYGTPAANVLFSGDGGGIFIGGIAAAGAGLTEGSGSVTIINNLIQGNLAGAGHGGGIRALGVNGADVQASANPANWYRLDIFNNVLVNNVAGYGGGGVSLSDVVNVRVVNNTVAHNDSTATAIAAFQNPGASTPQGAGLVTYRHSVDLQTAAGLPVNAYCDPVLQNNIFWENRSFGYDRTAGTLFPNPAGVYSDLQVADATSPAQTLHPTNCILTVGTAGYTVGNNLKVDPLFVLPYVNSLFVAVVIDEAGNNLSVRHEPISLFGPDGSLQGDYHLSLSPTPSPALGAGISVAGVSQLATDFDRDVRPSPAGSAPDIGADEGVAAGASIVPPVAPAVTVLTPGPAAAGAAPAVTGPNTGPGVPAGQPLAPLNLNPLPGDPLNPLLDPESLVDSDGDGNRTNDVAYYQLAAGDGWARMADGTELYTFGFSDVTRFVTNKTAEAGAGMPLINSINAIVTGPLANGGGGGLAGLANRTAARLQLLVLGNSLPVGNPVRASLLAIRLQINIVSQASGLAARNALIALVAQLRSNVELVLRDIGPLVQSEGLLAANLAAPTLVFKEGQHAYLDLANVGMLMRPDLFDPHTVHFHGFPQAASIFDGEPMASVAIGMGGTLRYYYRIVEPGTYLYHCHVEATEHMQMGMIGNLWVLPRQNHLADNTPLSGLPPTNGVARTVHRTGYRYAYNDGDGSTYYDVEAALQVTGFDRNFHEQHIAVQPLPFAALRDDYPLLNGRGYPDTANPNPLPPPASNDYARESQKVTSLVRAQRGQRILLRLSNVSETDIHTITVLGLPMKVVAKDARLLRGPDPDGAGPLVGKSLYYNTTSVKLGGGETTDAILDTTGVPAGTYLLYAARLNQLANDTEDYGGLMTEIVIAP